MSFFAALAGLGDGLANEGAYQEKLANAQALQREKLDAQREMALDRNNMNLQMAQMRADALAERGASSRGKGGYNLFEEMVNADTPEKQQRLAAIIRATSGSEDANAAVLDAYGRPKTETIQLPTKDDNGNDMPGPTSYQTRAKFDAQKGAIALQRTLAVAMDPAKLDSYSKGEAQTLRNDVVSKITLPDALKEGDRSVEGMNEALTPLNPKAGLDADKNSLAGERNEILRKAEEGKTSRLQTQVDARGSLADTKAIDAQILQERKVLATLGVPQSQKTAAEARIKELEARKESMRAAPAAPTAVQPVKPRSPQAAASAYRAGLGY